MNCFEFNPKRMHECVACGIVILDEPVFQLNPHEVICLRDYVEACVCMWSAGMYDHRTTP